MATPKPPQKITSILPLLSDCINSIFPWQGAMVPHNSHLTNSGSLHSGRIPTYFIQGKENLSEYESSMGSQGHQCMLPCLVTIHAYWTKPGQGQKEEPNSCSSFPPLRKAGHILLWRGRSLLAAISLGLQIRRLRSAAPWNIPHFQVGFATSAHSACVASRS